jgi:hypothetical protein
MKPALGDHGHVRAPGLHDSTVLAGHWRCMMLVVHRNEEAQGRGLVADHVHRPDRHVLAGNNAEQVDQRKSTFHGAAETHVIRVAGISAAVAIPQPPLRIHLVRIGAGPSLLFGRGSNRERHFGQDRGLEDARLAHQRDTPTLELQALKEARPRKRLAVEPRLLGQELEGGESPIATQSAGCRSD